MINPFYLRVWGDYACFTRPETKVERVSYPAITPSAARGILEAILFKPEFQWHVSRVRLLKKIQFVSFRRQELQSKANPLTQTPISVPDDRTLRNAMVLKDVEYILEAAIRPVPNQTASENSEALVSKYAGMARRRFENGQCFFQPSFGCREFSAFFELATADEMNAGEAVNENQDFGFMLYEVFNRDKPFRGPGPEHPQMTLFQARLEQDILEFPTWSNVRRQLELPQ